jgi:hypothetical protein
VTGSSTGITTVLHPVSALATAKRCMPACSACHRSTTAMTSPVAFLARVDIEARLADVTRRYEVKESHAYVGGGRLPVAGGGFRCLRAG